MDAPILENMHFLILENVDVPISQTQFQRVDFDSLDYDLGTRKQIWKYYVNQRDEIRQAYIKKGPHQPPEIFFFRVFPTPPKLEILHPSLDGREEILWCCSKCFGVFALVTFVLVL